MRTSKRLSLVICFVLVAAMAIVPMLTFTAFAADDVTLKVPVGLEAPAYDGTLPEGPEWEGYTFEGWSTTKVENTVAEPELLQVGDECPADVNTLYAVYSYEEESDGATSGKYVLVTDVTNLAAGDQVVIVSATTNHALSTTQNGNNRGQAAVNKSADEVTFGTDVQIITLEAGTVDGTFAFNAGNGYLYAASSSKNYLRTQTTNNANGSWSITIDASGIATVKAQGSNTRNWMRYNSSSSIFSCYGSGQLDISIYEYVEVSGSTSVTYYTSGDVNCTVSFSTPDGFESASSETVVYGNTLDSLPEVSGNGAYTFVGWAATALDEDTATRPEIVEAPYQINGDITLYAVYSYERDGVPTWQRVTDASTLSAGKKIVIAGIKQDSYYTISTTQNTNNRVQADASLAGDNALVFGDDTQIITLEAGTVDGTFAFNVGNGYLYAASSGSNHLKTQTTLDANGSWKIEIDSSTGIATVKAQGSNTRNWLRLNSSSALFSCYASGQLDIYIYSPGTGTGTATYYTANPVAEPTTPEIATATVTLGANLAMNYTVALPEGYVIDGMKMVFTMNGVSVTVEEDGTNVFTYTRLAPQCMGDTITADLYAADGTLVDTLDYSVKAYAEALLARYGNPELEEYDEYVTQLVVDMLNYGAAAQVYQNYKTDALVNADLEGAASDVTPTDADDMLNAKVNEEINPADYADYGLYAVGVRFDYVNKIFVRFKAPTLDGVTVLANGTEINASVSNDGYIAYSGAISALAFGDVITFELQVGGVTIQTLEYSVNTYANNKYEGGDAMADLALALYRYGASAVAYAENN